MRASPHSPPAAAGLLGAAAASSDVNGGPDVLRERVVDVFIDTLAVMATGSTRHEHQRLQDLLGTGAGKATVIGRSAPTSAAVAALLNGTTPTVYQMDEGHRRSRGHPGIHVVPVALALAEEGALPARRMLTAILAGYEAAARLGRALGGTVPDIHPHGNWGTIGAAVTAAHILSDADERTIASAIDMAAAVSLYPDRAATTSGSGSHHLFAALGGNIGIACGAAAAAGMTATPGCLENFMGPRSGVCFDRQVLLSGIDHDSATWSRHEILSNYFKFWPACAHTHTVLTALTELRDRERITPADIESVEVHAFKAAANLAAAALENDLAARYSIPAVVAATLVGDGYGLDSLRSAILASPHVRALISRVHVRHAPDLDSGYPDHGRPVTVTVRLRDGRDATASASLSYGDAEQAAARTAVHAKARDLLAFSFTRNAADDILSAALSLESGDDLTRLSGALRAAGRDHSDPAMGRRAVAATETEMHL